MTVSLDHPFVANRLTQNIAFKGFPDRVMPRLGNKIPFFYVVPEDIFESFHFQQPLIEETQIETGKSKTKKRKIKSDDPDVFTQYVLCLDIQDLENSLKE